MFSLDASHRYWFYNRPVNMRLGFNGLSGIVTNRMGMNLRDGDVFVFVNAARNRMKILHREEGGLVLYSLRIEMGRMRMPVTGDTDEISGILGYDSLISTAKSAMESPYVRRKSRVFRRRAFGKTGRWSICSP